LDGSKWLFSWLEYASIGRVITALLTPSVNKRRPSKRNEYKVVDTYITLWVAFFVLLVICPWFSGLASQHAYVFIVIASYRLFEIFQSWISQFVLGGVPTAWRPVNVNRSLLLAFEGYFEITVGFALFAFLLPSHFCGISDWFDALEYSVRNAVANGSGARDPLGLLLFALQMRFSEQIGRPVGAK
jgi:hypothetical protein